MYNVYNHVLHTKFALNHCLVADKSKTYLPDYTDALAIRIIITRIPTLYSFNSIHTLSILLMHTPINQSISASEVDNVPIFYDYYSSYNDDDD